MAATSQEDIAKLRKMTAGEMAECVVLRDELHLDCAGNEIPVGFREAPSLERVLQVKAWGLARWPGHTVSISDMLHWIRVRARTTM